MRSARDVSRDRFPDQIGDINDEFRFQLTWAARYANLDDTDADRGALTAIPWSFAEARTSALRWQPDAGLRMNDARRTAAFPVSSVRDGIEPWLAQTEEPACSRRCWQPHEDREAHRDALGKLSDELSRKPSAGA